VAIAIPNRGPEQSEAARLSQTCFPSRRSRQRYDVREHDVSDGVEPVGGVNRRVGHPDSPVPAARPVDVVAALAAGPGIGIRHFAAFAAVVEERSFRRAAKRLGYAQPTVSQQIAMLERTVSHELIERGAGQRSARPTPAGEELLGVVHQIAGLLAGTEHQLTQLPADDPAGGWSRPSAHPRFAQACSRS
jgi:molybdenum-dependent DNA-binding transcriptional regulator ModE